MLGLRIFVLIIRHANRIYVTPYYLRPLWFYRVSCNWHEIMFWFYLQFVSESFI